MAGRPGGGGARRGVPGGAARAGAVRGDRDGPGRDREATLTRLAERAAAVRVLLDGPSRRWTGGRPATCGSGRETKRSGERVVGWLGSVTTTVTVTDFTALGELMLRLADQDQVAVAGPWW